MAGKIVDKETLDKVREIDGFPIGKDEDIINLSDPPHYTPCPNPWLFDFIKEHGKAYDPKTDKYHKEPFSSDVAEGKNDQIYKVHSYHTKIPPKAIVRYILHYTNPGDVIFDGFCGSGMTGVATQICNNPDDDFKETIERTMKNVKWGNRACVLCDLSPVATFISNNLNRKIDDDFKETANELLSELLNSVGWMYETKHFVNDKIQYDLDGNNPILGKINYIVWSDVFICSNCTSEIIFTESISTKKIEKIVCKSCKSIFKKNELTRQFITNNDIYLNKIVKQAKQIPVLINYQVKGIKKMEKKPDDFDLELISKTNSIQTKTWFPLIELPIGVNTSQPKNSHGLNFLHQFYTSRNLHLISSIYEKLEILIQQKKFSQLFLFEQIIFGMSKLARYVPTHYSQVNQYLTGVLYIASQIVEVPPNYIINEKKILNLEKTLSKLTSKSSIISTQSSTNLKQIYNDSVDYIFTDPPFGKNINYSELNFFWESWIKIRTNNECEAIINKVQKKGLVEYQELMEKCFKENYRILKPGRWMTVVFSNSKNIIWKSIQEALQRAGFVVANVANLDKKQVSFKQVTSSNAIKQDLAISAYKPSGSLDKFFGGLSIGSEEGVWKFIDIHLKQLPVFVEKENTVEIILERQKHLLYDRMTAFHVQKGLTIPITSKSEFSEKLSQKYVQRDDMYFLSEQIPEYDQKRAKVKSIEQSKIFIEDEKSSILWLNEQLKTPQTYEQIQPKFFPESHPLPYEKLPELDVILEQNFIQDENKKWHIPDPTKLKDLEKLREKSLLREFQIYSESKSKLKQFRLEAIRAGFKKKWSENNYKSIVDTGKKLPEEIIQEDNDLLMYYDNASSRL